MARTKSRQVQNGKTAIEAAAIQGWVRAQLKKESRGGITPLSHETSKPRFEVHASWARSSQAIKRWIAVGSCPEPRIMNLGEQQWTCECQEEMPTVEDQSKVRALRVRKWPGGPHGEMHQAASRKTHK